MAEEQRAPEMRRGLRLRISGRVQGVGFRWYAREVADSLGVRGYVRNLPTGQVEIWAEADGRALEAFVAAMRRGPRHAVVREVDAETVEPEGRFRSFRIEV